MSVAPPSDQIADGTISDTCTDPTAQTIDGTPEPDE